MSLLPGFAAAEATYKTYTGDFQRTPDAYEPAGSIEKAGDTEFATPSDIFIDGSDTLYIADTDNSRIVVMTRGGELIRTIGEDVLDAPSGVFAGENGDVYVADSGLEQVLHFSKEGKVLQTLGRPETPLYGKSTPYKPMKVTVDKRGNVYIISEGTTNGVIQMSPEGDFMGFFGTNDSKPSAKLVLQRFFFTKKQIEKLFKNVPNTPTNVAIDALGLVYTITQGDKDQPIKRLNISGYNLIPGTFWDPSYTDISVSAAGNIFAVGQRGYFYEFDSEGHLLFVSGSPDDGKSREGLLLNGAGIATDSKGYVYITDVGRNSIQVYEPTEFVELVHHALDLYKDGLYVKSQAPWNLVEQRNSLFVLAHRGLGDAYIKQELYAKAMAEYKQAKDVSGYSNAFWEIRNRWLQHNLLTVVLIIIGLMVLRSLLRWLHRRTGILAPAVRVKKAIMNVRLIRELLYIGRFIKHPLDGLYGLREEGRTSAISAALLYALLIVEYLFTLYCTGFIFDQADASTINLTKELAMLIAPLALWIVSNYLVSTITDGEGKFSQVYQGTIYAFAPYLIFHPIVVIASNVLTLNDAFLFSFSNAIITAWCAVLLFLMVKEVHDYTVRETLRNLFITLFTMLITSLVLFIVYVILHQVYDFADSVIQEMITRAEQ